MRRGPTINLRVVCRLRELRGDATIAELADRAYIHRGTLSQLERGERLPRPAHITGLERAYGPRVGWYAVEVEADEAQP